VPRADHAARACLAALDHLAVVDALDAEALDGAPRLSVRIGINTGEMIVGNIGGAAAQDYTVIGDAVNLAERVESANREYGTRLLVTEAVVRAAGDAIAAREIDRVALPGRAAAVTLYEIASPAAAADPGWRANADRHAEGLAALRARRFAEAAAAFAACTDEAGRVLGARAETFAAAPPPPGWDGTYRRMSK
jgi:adenylate cyclase